MATIDEYAATVVQEKEALRKEAADLRARAEAAEARCRELSEDLKTYQSLCTERWEMIGTVCDERDAAIAKLATVRRETIEEAAVIVEDTDIETYGGWENPDDARGTLGKAAAALRALAAETKSTEGGGNG